MPSHNPIAAGRLLRVCPPSPPSLRRPMCPHPVFSLTRSPTCRGVAKEFKGKDVEKGIAVPTCVSVNQCVGHHSPMPDCAIELKEGDLVKM